MEKEADGTRGVLMKLKCREETDMGGWKEESRQGTELKREVDRKEMRGFLGKWRKRKE